MGPLTYASAYPPFNMCPIQTGNYKCFYFCFKLLLLMVDVFLMCMLSKLSWLNNLKMNKCSNEMQKI